MATEPTLVTEAALAAIPARDVAVSTVCEDLGDERLRPALGVVIDSAALVSVADETADAIDCAVFEAICAAAAATAGWTVEPEETAAFAEATTGSIAGAALDVVVAAADPMAAGRSAALLALDDVLERALIDPGEEVLVTAEDALLLLDDTDAVEEVGALDAAVELEDTDALVDAEEVAVAALAVGAASADLAGAEVDCWLTLVRCVALTLTAIYISRFFSSRTSFEVAASPVVPSR